MKLSVIIPNRNDTVMLGITVRSVLEALKAIGNDGEIVIVDNSDESIWEILKTVNKSPIPLAYVQEGKIQLIRQTFPSLYSARAEGIRQARGEYSFGMDSHMLVGHNMFKDLVEFMDADKENRIGFAFAPIGWLGQHESFARHDIRINGISIYGNWGRRYYKPTKICWNFGTRICRTKWFNGEFDGYGFFDRKRLSWGGGEFYVPMKGWLLGYESWAVPTNPIYHIGPFSDWIVERTCYRYRQYGDRSGNGKWGIGIFAAFYALGGDEMKEEARKAELAGAGKNYGLSVDRDWEEARILAYEDWLWVKEHQKMTYFEMVKKQPWKMEGWGDWDNWSPNIKLNKAFNLSDIKIVK